MVSWETRFCFNSKNTFNYWPNFSSWNSCFSTVRVKGLTRRPPVLPPAALEASGGTQLPTATATVVPAFPHWPNLLLRKSVSRRKATPLAATEASRPSQLGVMTPQMTSLSFSLTTMTTLSQLRCTGKPLAKLSHYQVEELCLSVMPGIWNSLLLNSLISLITVLGAMFVFFGDIRLLLMYSIKPRGQTNLLSSYPIRISKHLHLAVV